MKKCLFALILMGGFFQPAFVSEGRASSEFPDTEDLTNTSHVGAPQDPESQESNTQGARLGDTENLTPSEQDTEDRKDMFQRVPLGLEEFPSSYSSVSLPDLPAELVVMITAYLPLRDTASLMQTCKYLYGTPRGFPGMRSFRFSNGDCESETIFDHLSFFFYLRHVDLSGYFELTDAGLRCLPNSLTSLNLSSGYNITDAGVAHLSPLSNLTFLNLSWCWKITNAGLKHLPPNLTFLNLSGCNQVTDKNLTSLPASLTHLNLSWCSNVTDAGLRHLPKSLTHLNLSWCWKITNAGVAHLFDLSHLTSLDLSGCDRITGVGLENFLHLKLLTLLRPTNFTPLGLSWCSNVTDEGLKDLFPNLTSLDLSVTAGTEGI